MTKRARAMVRAMALATRVECNKESNGFGGKSSGNNQLAMGACDKGGQGGKAMAMGIRVAGGKEGKGDKKGHGVSNKGGV